MSSQFPDEILYDLFDQNNPWFKKLLSLQQERGGSLCNFAISEGIVSELDLLKAFSKRNHSPYVTFDFEKKTYEISMEFCDEDCRLRYCEIKQYEKFAKNGSFDKMEFDDILPSAADYYNVISIQKIENKLLVAIVDPLNIFALDDLQLITSCTVYPVSALFSDIRKFIPESTSQKVDTNESFIDRVSRDFLDDAANGFVYLQKALRERKEDIMWHLPTIDSISRYAREITGSLKNQ